jgi:hypothetical protein
MFETLPITPNYINLMIILFSIDLTIYIINPELLFYILNSILETFIIFVRYNLVMKY